MLQLAHSVPRPPAGFTLHCLVSIEQGMDCTVLILKPPGVVAVPAQRRSAKVSALLSHVIVTTQDNYINYVLLLQ